MEVFTNLVTSNAYKYAYRDQPIFPIGYIRMLYIAMSTVVLN